jgi:hypothetical protein
MGGGNDMTEQQRKQVEQAIIQKIVVKQLAIQTMIRKEVEKAKAAG